MNEITDQNQPVSYSLSLTCGSCIRAGQRAAAGKATRAKGRTGDTSRVQGGVVTAGRTWPMQRGRHCQRAARRALNKG